MEIYNFAPPPLTLANKYSISNNSILLFADANKSEFACHLVRNISTQANDYCLLNIKMDNGKEVFIMKVITNNFQKTSNNSKKLLSLRIINLNK